MFMASDKVIAKNPMKRKLYPLVTNKVLVTAYPDSGPWEYSHRDGDQELCVTNDTDTGMLYIRHPRLVSLESSV